jgi:hypothetical protein
MLDEEFLLVLRVELKSSMSEKQDPSPHLKTYVTSVETNRLTCQKLLCTIYTLCLYSQLSLEWHSIERHI